MAIFTATALAYAAIASAVVGAGATIYGAKQTEEATEEQNAIQSAQQKITDVNTARKKVKEARVARARLLQGSQAAGTTGGSGEAGGLASLNTQLATNLAEQTGQARTANNISAVSSNLASKQLVTQSVGAVAGAAQSIFTQQAIGQAKKGP
jgi:preprotein translocase subunit SecF